MTHDKTSKKKTVFFPKYIYKQQIKPQTKYKANTIKNKHHI